MQIKVTKIRAEIIKQKRENYRKKLTTQNIGFLKNNVSKFLIRVLWKIRGKRHIYQEFEA